MDQPQTSTSHCSAPVGLLHMHAHAHNSTHMLANQKPFAQTALSKTNARVCCCMHRFAIEKLRTQNAKLKEDLLLENKFSVRPSNPGATILINKLQDEADLYTRKVWCP